MLVKFKQYLHGGDLWEDAEWLSEQTGYQFTDELISKMGEPFYEVGLECTVDTETGEVTLLRAWL